jgi:hypothetical protein
MSRTENEMWLIVDTVIANYRLPNESISSKKSIAEVLIDYKRIAEGKFTEDCIAMPRQMLQRLSAGAIKVLIEDAIQVMREDD